MPDAPADGPREELLRGGNSAGPVVRIGETVRRRRTAASPFVAELLAHLAAAGFTGAPRHLGVDEQGRDVFRYVEGAGGSHWRERCEEAYAAAGGLLRALHDATSGHRLAGDQECVLHGDPGPFNTVFRAGLPVALIDWDCARPGARLHDLAYMGWTWCIEATPALPVPDQARRLRALRDGYGADTAVDLVAAILERQRGIAEAAAALLQRRGEAAAFSAHQRGAIAWANRDHEHLERHAATFRAALA